MFLSSIRQNDIVLIPGAMQIVSLKWYAIVVKALFSIDISPTFIEH